MKSFFALIIGISIFLLLIIWQFIIPKHVFNDIYTFKGIYTLQLDDAYNLQEKYGRRVVDMVSIDASHAVVSIDISTYENKIYNINGTVSSDQSAKIASYVFMSIGILLLIVGIIGLVKISRQIDTDEIGRKIYRHNYTCGHCGYSEMANKYDKDIKLQHTIKCPMCKYDEFYLMY